MFGISDVFLIVKSNRENVFLWLEKWFQTQKKWLGMRGFIANPEPYDPIQQSKIIQDIEIEPNSREFSISISAYFRIGIGAQATEPLTGKIHICQLELLDVGNPDNPRTKVGLKLNTYLLLGFTIPFVKSLQDEMAGAFESIQKPDVQQQILDQIKIIAPNYTASEVIASSIDQPIEPAAFPTSRKLDEIFDWYHQRINTGMKVTLGDLAKKFGYSESYLKQQHALFLNERGIKKENTKTNR